jgi:hypothetical protein
MWLLLLYVVVVVIFYVVVVIYYVVVIVVAVAYHFTNSFPLVIDGVVVVEDVDDLHLDLEAQHLRNRLHDSGIV